VQPAAYSQQRAFRHHGKRARYIAVRVFEPEELDGPGVGALLERDRKCALFFPQNAAVCL
jgi:hypothetical protein